MLEVCPVCGDTSAKMSTPLADSSDVASSTGSAGTATASHTINGSSASMFPNKVLKPPLVHFFVFSARQHICYSALFAIVRPSVCPSVRPSHGWISQRRLKLGSRNLHHRVAP